MTDEVWLPVPDYDGLYSVSNLGRVRKEEHTVYYGDHRDFRKEPQKIKKQQLSSNKKYLFTTLSKDKKTIHVGVHRIMAWAFFGEQKEGIEVRHKNGNSLDNRIENLCYGTKSDNMKDAIKHGTFQMSEWHSCAKLTNDQVKEIILSTENYQIIARRFGIHPNTVHKLRRGEVRKHDSKLFLHLQPKKPRPNKFDLLSSEQLNILNDHSITQRDAGKLIGVPQRTIWKWRNR